MTLIKKADVKAHFAARRLKGIHPVRQEQKSAGSGLPAVNLQIETNVPGFVDDFSLEHSSKGGTVSAVVIVGSSGDFQVPETSSTPKL